MSDRLAGTIAVGVTLGLHFAVILLATTDGVAQSIVREIPDGTFDDEWLTAVLGLIGLLALELSYLVVARDLLHDVLGSTVPRVFAKTNLLAVVVGHFAVLAALVLILPAFVAAAGVGHIHATLDLIWWFATGLLLLHSITSALGAWHLFGYAPARQRNVTGGPTADPIGELPAPGARRGSVTLPRAQRPAPRSSP